MEILKNNLRALTIAAFIMMGMMTLKAQTTNYKPIEDAFETSYTLEKKADYTGAVKAMKAVYDENSYEINVRIAWLCYMSGLFTESTAYYQKAMKLKPYAIEPKLGFAYPASALGNWDQVTAQYLDILKIDPQNTVVNYRMGSIMYGKNDFESAAKYLEKVINLYPFDYDSNILYAWTMFKLGKMREAQVLFHKVLMIKPADASALEGLGAVK